MAYAKALREQLAPVVAQITAITAKAESEKNRGLTSEEREQFNKLVNDHTALEDSIAMAEKADDIVSRLAAAPAVAGNIPSDLQLEEVQDTFRVAPGRRKELANHMKDPHYRAFHNLLRVSPQLSLSDGLSTEDKQVLFGNVVNMGVKWNPKSNTFQNAQQSTGGAAGGFGTSGGYLVPQGFSDQLEEAKKWFGGIAGVVEKFTTETGNPLPWPTMNDTANKGQIIGQNVQVRETDIVFGQVTFNAFIGSSDLILIPLAMQQDSYFDLDALIARLLGTRLGRLYNWKCTVGAGTTEPTGIVTAAVAVGSTVTYATGQSFLPKYPDLVNVEHGVDPAYRYNPGTAWMFSDTMLKGIKSLVDGGGRPLWQPGLNASFREGAVVDIAVSRPTILDHPYYINQDMAIPASGAASMLFGDMYTFKVREVAGGTTLMRLNERYADYFQTGYIAFQRFDSGLVDAGTHPIVVGISPTS